MVSWTSFVPRVAARTPGAQRRSQASNWARTSGFEAAVRAKPSTACSYASSGAVQLVRSFASRTALVR